MDFQATMHRPLTLARLVGGAREIAAELLGLPDVAAPRLVTGRVYEVGEVVQAGRVLTGPELGVVQIGPGVADPQVEVVNAQGSPLTALLASVGGTDWRLVCVANRHPFGIVMSLAIALAAARQADGRLVGDDLGLAEAAGVPDGDPLAFIDATRLPEDPAREEDPAVAYLHQFEHLQGGPIA